jgi:3-oxoacyl-[acyl-carrier-protein] synthase III
VPNSEIVDLIDSSDEWIRERSGIVSRRFAAPEETVVDMSEAAAREAITAAGLEPSQISAVVLATVTHPYQTPAAAPMVADRLGIQGAAFDISAACAGYCHGIALASDMVRGGSAEHVLVIGVEKLSDFTDPTDRGSAFIFGDGAGAAVVGPSDFPGIGPTVWGSDGAQWKTISQRDPWVSLRERASDVRWPAITMQGQAVFRWAVWGMAPVAQQALDAAGVKADDLDAFIPHQANMRIIDAMIKQLKLPEHIPVARDIAETANTSAASIPLALAEAAGDGRIRPGHLVLTEAMGGGFTWGSALVRW